MFLHEPLHAGDKEWELERCAVDEAKPAVRNFHMIRVNHLMPETLRQKPLSEWPDDHAAHPPNPIFLPAVLRRVKAMRFCDP